MEKAVRDLRRTGMSDKSAIEWTDATWNPVTGCVKVSPGCDHCYAERFAERFRGVKGNAYEQGFDLKFHENRLDQPLRWKRPRMVFVNSMSDLFLKDVPNEYIDRVFEVMEKATQHTFQVLTKRSGRMRRYLRQRGGCGRNIWCGVSVEDQARKVRIEHLRDTPIGTTRFLSIEPLLENLRLQWQDLDGIHWVIVGGESGPGARPMEREWVRLIRNACKMTGTPFFFKQWGGISAKAGGRTLDGKTYDEMPRNRM